MSRLLIRRLLMVFALPVLERVIMGFVKKWRLKRKKKSPALTD